MADKIFFKTGLASSLPTTKTAGQLLFAIDGTTGSIYLDKDNLTRIKFNADAAKLETAVNLQIGNTEKSFDGTKGLNWSHSEIGADITDFSVTPAVDAVSLNLSINSSATSILNLPEASLSQAGIITAEAQTIKGTKTLYGNMVLGSSRYSSSITSAPTLTLYGYKSSSSTATAYKTLKLSVSGSATSSSASSFRPTFSVYYNSRSSADTTSYSTYTGNYVLDYNSFYPYSTSRTTHSSTSGTNSGTFLTYLGKSSYPWDIGYIDVLHSTTVNATTVKATTVNATEITAETAELSTSLLIGGEKNVVLSYNSTNECLEFVFT